MKDILINRDFSDEKQTLGVCYVKDENEVVFKSEAIERGWMDNKKMISCVPDGTYLVVLEHSAKFGKELYELKEVPNRAECKFHAANFARQLNGCIALGKDRKDIDGDGYFDVTSSAKTMKAFHKALNGDKRARVVIKTI